MLDRSAETGGERVLWQGRCGVAEYAFDHVASLPRWTLPETTEVTVTDHRVLYAHCTDPATMEVTSGEMRWLWPLHLRLQPGTRDGGRARSATQVQLVCGGADGSFPALVFAGGDLATVADADRLANVIRQAVARFRIDNAAKLDLPVEQVRMLSRLLIGPEFMNHLGGEGQTVSLLGALPVSRPAAPEPEPVVTPPARIPGYRPGQAADAARALLAERAEQETHHTEPDLASRAARIAAQVADLVSGEGPAVLEPVPAPESALAPPARDVRPAQEVRPADAPTVNLAERAGAIRRSAARLAANSPRDRLTGRRNADREFRGVPMRGNRGG